jgi:hypothetical protein
MKIAIMQPYFLPYIGYFQLLNSVDKFVIYDNIQFTKRGWIHRNRMLLNGADDYFTLPLKKASDFLNVNQRELSDSFEIEKVKILRKINELYSKSPQYDKVHPMIVAIFNYSDKNLFEFILNAINVIKNYLDIQTEIIISSSISINHDLKSEVKVIAICKALGAKEYVNAIGGIDLYTKSTFLSNGIDLNFIKSNPIEYLQFDKKFVPWLSILDVLYFNSKEKAKEYLSHYTII